MTVTIQDRALLSGNEAIALGALHSGVVMGTGYPGTPSTEILENFDRFGGHAQWAPNEKVALEVGLGSAYGGGRTLVTMKHVGVNVAADPLFTASYTGVRGGLILISADDPGMASSQNEQDNRHYARAAAVPMLEPADSQEAYDFMRLGLELSERWEIPIILRVTTRVCHSKTIVIPREPGQARVPQNFERNVQELVMIPAYARTAHRRLRGKLEEMAEWNENEGPNEVIEGSGQLGIIASGIAAMYAQEAAPEAKLLKLGMTWPLPLEKIRAFAESVDRCLVIEENDPCLFESLKAADINVEQKDPMFRFGELNVDRVRRIINNDTSEEKPPIKGKPPELCKGCPHFTSMEVVKENDCIVSGDIGCYTLSVLPPLDAMDTCVCMGASIGVGLGLRHVLPEEDARRVISVIGDSTFMHSGVTSLIEMVYNPPETGHVVLILDNGTTAMTGMQEHPGTGRTLDHEPTQKVDFEMLVRSMGINDVHIVDQVADRALFEDTLKGCMKNNELSVIIARRACVLAGGAIRQYEQAALAKANADAEGNVCECGHGEC